MVVYSLEKSSLTISLAAALRKTPSGRRFFLNKRRNRKKLSSKPCFIPLSANFLFLGERVFQNGVYVSPLAGLKIIIRLTQGFATLTLGFYVAGPLGRQYDAHQSPSTTSTQSTTSTTAAKRQKPGGRHIEAQGKPGRQARRSPGGDGI
jgi:hypothetical protein